jgi:nucleoside-diphosphate-sugar epimerase
MSGVAALTGASGFIGSRVLARLQADGWQVRALSRSPPAASSSRVTWVAGDLSQEGIAAELVSGVDTVVHCAGTVSGASEAHFLRANTEATRRLVEAAARQGTRPRLMVLSSLAARYPALSPYARSKRLAEDAVTTHAGDMPWTILRPTAVYGPGDKALAPLLRMLARGWLPVPGQWAARVTLLHVDDLVNAIAVGLSTPVAPWGCFELDDGTDGGYSWWGIAAAGEQAFERRVRFLPVPASGLYAAASVNQALARVLGYTPMLTPGKVRELRHDDWRCNYRPYRELTGWWPRLGLADALLQGRLGIE